MGFFSGFKKIAKFANPITAQAHLFGKATKPKLPKDNSADLARRAEEERQGRIKQGEKSIADTFAQYDDGFFDNYRGAYLGAQTPQLNDQFEDAKEQASFGLARSGLLGSSAGADTFGNLQRRFNDATVDLGAGADNAVRELRAAIEAKRNELLTNNRSAADPTAAKSGALAATANFQAAPDPGPLTDVFTGLLNGGALAAQTGAFDRTFRGAGASAPNPALPNRKSVQVIR